MGLKDQIRGIPGNVKNAWASGRAQNIRNKSKTIIVGGAGLMGGLAAKGVKGARDKAEGLDLASKKTLGNVFAFFAIILWVVDVLPGLGGVYSGFNFDPKYFWSNWLSKFTFGNMWFDAGLAIFVIFFAFTYLRKGLLSGKDLFCFVFFLTAILFFVANPSWVAYPKAVIHFIFIILFGLFYVRQTDDLNTAFIIIAGLLFFDFFFFSTLLKFIPFFKYISLLSSIIIIWTFAQSPTGFTAVVFVVLMIFIIIVSVAEGMPAKGFYFQESEIQKSTISDLGDRIRDGIGNYQKQIASSVGAQIQYAITGKVEENQHEPLGVYLENAQSAEPRYYEDEDVTVWGVVKARTLDDPINIKVGCYVKKGKEKRYAKADPEKKFTVFALEEQDFSCTFAKNQSNKSNFESGTYTITTFADFNFETLAYLKAYFMDKERLRAMLRDDQDVFEEFGIKDTKPVPVYTNGPATIEMGATSSLTTGSLIGVSDSYIVYPRLTLTLQNREGWEGKINQVTELVLFFPKGAGLNNPEADCNYKFKPYSEVNCKEDSCKGIVNKECMDVCSGFTMSSNAYKNCEISCNENLKKCQKECEFLFEDQGEKYIGYSLDLSDLKVRDEFKDLEKFKDFNCKFNPMPKDVLEDAPITTKYFRVKARYNYTVEKPVSVNIVEVPA